MELYGDPVHLIQVELNIYIRIHRLTLKEVSFFLNFLLLPIFQIFSNIIIHSSSSHNYLPGITTVNNLTYKLGKHSLYLLQAQCHIGLIIRVIQSVNGFKRNRQDITLISAFQLCDWTLMFSSFLASPSPRFLLPFILSACQPTYPFSLPSCQPFIRPIRRFILESNIALQS